MILILSSRIWEDRILETLDRRPNKKNDYVLLRSEQACLSQIKAPCRHRSRHLIQLVGTALLVLVKSELTPVIRNVEGTSRKVIPPCDASWLPSSFVIDWPARDVRKQRRSWDPARLSRYQFLLLDGSSGSRALQCWRKKRRLSNYHTRTSFPKGKDDTQPRVRSNIVSVWSDYH